MAKLILAIVLFSVLGFYYFNDLNSPSFHPDEYEFIRKSYYFDLFFVNKDIKDLRWYQKDAPAQPKVGPYIYGLTLHLAGINNIETYLKDIKFDEVKIDNQYWSEKLWWKSLVNLSPEVINVLQPVLLGRITAIIFTLSAFAILFLIGYLFKSIALGLFSTIILATNLLMSWYGKLAITDSMQLFFFLTNLLLVFFLVSAFQNKDSRKILLISLAVGINCFFGVGVKISGILIYVFLTAIYILLAVFNRTNKKKLNLIIMSFLISSITFFALFTLLHPYLYKNPPLQFVSMFTSRLSYSRAYMLEQPQIAVPSRADATRLILKRTLLPHGRFTNFKSLSFPLDAVLFLVGMILMVQQSLKQLLSKRISGELLLVIWIILVITSLIFYLKTDWPRFYLPTVSVIVISQAYALAWVFYLVLEKIRKVPMFRKMSKIKLVKNVTMKKFNKNKLAKIMVVFLALVALIALSEFIYRYRIRPEPTLADYLQIAEELAQKSRVEKSILNLGRASNMKVKYEVAYTYPDLSFNTLFALPILPQNEKLEQDFADYLKSIEYDRLLTSYATKWAKPFYSLGLLAYQNNEPNLVEPFWKQAINLAPEWSYLHAELANFYLTKDNIDKANLAIEYCLTFENPKNHCQEYLENNIHSNTPVPVGTWEENIIKEI